ncbi:PREDICTED: uncharacterized protein LOC104825702 [Tarenaya hassleriana]|uniref:uncharacterized protein LOC104825702 n=1 Tax=Tarenaya hassleriana TaxID=28532 RepID=UPI00053C25A6|nr:PREDICTED: uncharacterized protein LOC104825702 [Tarenaya hassleriana]
MGDLLADEEERRTRADSTDKKRVRDELGESDIDSPEVKRLRDDLLDVLDDSDPDPASQELDSVMKSFEDELSAMTGQGSGETQPDLGYLLEASDDELGLPPPPALPHDPSCSESKDEETVTELVRASSDSSEVGEFWEFEDQMTSCGSFELGVGDGDGGGFVEVDELFEYSDYCFDSGDVLPLRPETLPSA